MVIINAAAGSGQGQVAQRFAKILFTINYAASTNAATVLAALAAIKLKVTKLHPDYGQIELFKEGPLLERLELNAHLQSAINVTNDGTNTTVRGSILMVDETIGGSIKPKQDEKYQFDVTAIPDSVTVTVNAIEFPGNARVGYSSNYVFCAANVATPVNVAGSKLLAMDRTKLSNLELVYPDGKNIVLTPAEISDLMDDHKAAAYVKNGLVTPGGELLYIIDVEAATSALVTYSASGNVQTLSPVAL